jgi:hypothetical protein
MGRRSARLAPSPANLPTVNTKRQKNRSKRVRSRFAPAQTLAEPTRSRPGGERTHLLLESGGVGQLRRGGAAGGGGEPVAALLLEALVAGLPADLHHLVLTAAAGLRRIHRDLVVALARIRALARTQRHGAASSRNPSADGGWSGLGSGKDESRTHARL